MSAPLLATKLYIPARRPNLVPRPRLMARLEEALRLRHRLTLVSARAGAGKTTLVSEWLHEQHRPAMWLSLDGNDNDPRRFCTYLFAALHALGLKIRSGGLEAPQLPDPAGLMADLINDVAASTGPFLVVLDDYHLIENDWIHEAVGFLAEHQPPEMHMTLIARVDPPLPLARMRGRGLITEVRDYDLRFTADEAGQFLKAMELDLSSEAVSTLERRTEGWIVGLQMAAISMQGRQQEGDLTGFVEAFGGTNRYILDYLMEEVLNQQPVAVQRFLIETSILSRMCADLCDAVRFGVAESPSSVKATAVRSEESGAPSSVKATAVRSEESGAPSSVEATAVRSGEGEPRGGARATAPIRGEVGDSQAILTQLERTNLFLMPLDDERRWYRYHHLFADLVNSALRQRRSADEVRALHRRASLWHQAAGSLEEAMVHAMAAQDFQRAASMIEENIVTMLSRSEAPVLLGWIEKLPEHIVQGRPWIDVYRANALALSGRLEPIEPLLEGVERRIDPADAGAAELLGHIAAIRAYSANLLSDAPRALEMGELAERYLPPGEHLTARGMAAYALAETHFARDNMDGANQASLTMLHVGEKTGRLLMAIPALCDLAAIRKVQGRLYQAEECYDRARQWLEERRGMDSRVRCPYEAGLADLWREWNQLGRAQEHAQTGINYSQRYGVYSLLVSSYVALMRVLQARGDVEGAMEALRAAERTMQTHHVRLATRIELCTARVVQWLAVGDVETASHCAGEFGGNSELEQMALARLCLAQGQASDVLNLLDGQRVSAQAGGRMGRLIEILSLQALALEALDQGDAAEEALAEALSLARPEGYVRLFLDLGGALPEILGRVAARSAAEARGTPLVPVAGAYVRSLLDAFHEEQEAEKSRVAAVAYSQVPVEETLVDPLTDREQEVLHLLAEGLTNKKIADRLIVAPSTVKQHLKNIYSKLDVHSRTEAVARGRDLNLL